MCYIYIIWLGGSWWNGSVPCSSCCSESQCSSSRRSGDCCAGRSCCVLLLQAATVADSQLSPVGAGVAVWLWDRYRWSPSETHLAHLPFDDRGGLKNGTYKSYKGCSAKICRDVNSCNFIHLPGRKRPKHWFKAWGYHDACHPWMGQGSSNPLRASKNFGTILGWWSIPIRSILRHMSVHTLKWMSGMMIYGVEITWNRHISSYI